MSKAWWCVILLAILGCVSPQTRKVLNETRGELDRLRVRVDGITAEDPESVALRETLENRIKRLESKERVLSELASRERVESFDKAQDLTVDAVDVGWRIFGTMFPAIGTFSPLVNILLAMFRRKEAVLA